MAETATAPARRPAASRVRTQEQATSTLGRIGAAQVELGRLKAALDAAVAGLRLDYEEKAAPLRAAVATDTDLLRGYFEANRATLLTGRKKSAELATGTAGWKKAAERVVVAEGVNLLEILEADRKLKRFIRTTSAPDLQALLAEPKVAITIQGVSIVGGDDAFFVKPLVLAPT